MVLELADSSETQPILWFSLDQFVDEVSSLAAPLIRNLRVFDLHLLGQHKIADLVPRPAIVGPLYLWLNTLHVISSNAMTPNAK